MLAGSKYVSSINADDSSGTLRFNFKGSSHYRTIEIERNSSNARDVWPSCVTKIAQRHADKFKTICITAALHKASFYAQSCNIAVTWWGVINCFSAATLAWGSKVQNVIDRLLKHVIAFMWFWLGSWSALLDLSCWTSASEISLTNRFLPKKKKKSEWNLVLFLIEMTLRLVARCRHDMIELIW